jgi:hypothetical protein
MSRGESRGRQKERERERAGETEGAREWKGDTIIHTHSLTHTTETEIEADFT